MNSYKQVVYNNSFTASLNDFRETYIMHLLFFRNSKFQNNYM